MCLKSIMKRLVLIMFLYFILQNIVAQHIFNDSFGIQLAYGGEDLLKGGPRLGPGAGLAFYSYPFELIDEMLISANLIFFLPQNESKINFLAINSSADICYQFFKNRKISFSPGIGVIYDYCNDSQYSVNEVSVMATNKIFMKFDNSIAFLQSSLELGGFDTYLFSVGYLINL